ncbi:hypothetical protein [Pseudomonas sp. LB3P58]
MTNKFEISRELLERAASAIEKHHSSLQWVVASELRALLDNHSEEPLGVVEPVARDHQVTELSEFMGRLSGGLRHFAGQIIDAGWKKACQLRIPPIGFRDPEFTWATISAENKAKMVALGHDLSCFSVPLYTSPPVPVAVVLPDREDENNDSCGNDPACWYPQGWNACLDKVKELNQ